jgi:hypothetical protein
MILHFSHIGLTDGRTFTADSLSISGKLWSWFLGLGSGDRYGRRYRAEEARAVKQLALQAHRGILAGA